MPSCRFLNRVDGFWGHSPNIWWPEDHAWCVATDIDLFDTYVGGSRECIKAILSDPDPGGASYNP